ncbi:flagellar filament capping protein FliD [Clostridium sediminicola]|uniref:flagellar filament capping protein FliD n=1 Tax=Clostridium sediminicola TaxID=3114879 RepID=UPI0031F1CA0B
MSGINFLGSYSGIDQSMIDQLMAAEKMPLIGMSTKVQDYETEKNAWKDINTRMNTLSTKINALKNDDLYNDKKFNSSESGIVNASVSNDAIEGDYKIEVTTLAKSTTLVGDKVKPPTASLNQSGTLSVEIVDGATFDISVESGDSVNDIAQKINESVDNTDLVTAYVVNSELVLESVELGKVVNFTDDQSDAIVNAVKNDLNLSGILNIKVGENNAESITITGTDSLSDIVDKINKLDNVSASIIDYQLVLKSNQSGEQSITLTDSDSDNIINSIGMSTADETLGNDSIFKVNGISVTRSSNEISDVVSGLTFDLTKEGTTTLTISKDYSDLESKIESLVEQYNSTLSFMQLKSKAGEPGKPGGEAGKQGGDLAGDSALQRLISNLRTSVSDTISDITSDYKTASNIGIKTIDNEGTLSFDKTKFQEAMSNDSEAVKNFFFSKNASNEDTGFTNKIDGFLDYYIDSSDGIIASKETSLDSMIKTVDKRIEAFNDRMEAKEAYYIKIFAKLDSYMAKAESTTSWLTSQMGAMNSSSNQ